MIAPSRTFPAGNSRSAVSLLTGALLACCAAGADAADAVAVTVHAAAALKGPINELAATFERTSGQRVVPVFDTAGAAEQKFLAGDGTGILISSAARSEIVQSDPAALAGPFPPEFDLATSYVLWHRKSAAPAVAAFAAEVATAEGRAVLQRHGLRAR